MSPRTSAILSVAANIGVLALITIQAFQIRESQEMIGVLVEKQNCLSAIVGDGFAIVFGEEVMQARPADAKCFVRIDDSASNTSNGTL